MDQLVRGLAVPVPAAPLRDRRRAAVRIRRVDPRDVSLLDAFIRGLSPASRQWRFHVGIRELAPPWLERMAHPDPADELALVALTTDGGRDVCVAEARYVLSEEIAVGREFALAVADGWQGRGIGKTLLLSLGAHAMRQGVPRLVGDVLRDNLAMLALARTLGYTVQRHPADPRLVRVERSFAAAVVASRPRVLAAESFI